MSTERWTVHPRTAMIATICALSGVYGVIMAGYHLGVPQSNSGQVSITETNPSIASGEVPDAVLKSLTNHLSDLQDMEELVVLPTTGGGYSVSATVQVDSAGANSVSKDFLEQDVKSFFVDVYGSDASINDAKIFFMQGQNVVGGAGLTGDAYRKLSVNTSTSATDFASQLAASGDALPGASDAWFATNLDSANP